MFMPLSLFHDIGGFDETFFMYGEDLDLCYRVTEKGCKVWYNPRTQIVHFKGRSSAKMSLHSRKAFYEAMLIFSRKYRSVHKSFLPGWVIATAIAYFGALSVASTLFITFPAALIDFLVINGVLFAGITIRFSWGKLDSPYLGAHIFAMIGMHLLLTAGFVFLFALRGVYSKERYSPGNAVVSGLFASLMFMSCAYFFKSNEIMEILPGPDFPHRLHDLRSALGIKEAYPSGRGRVVVRARSSIEEQKDSRAQIVFSDIPYQLTKEPLLKKLAELVNGGRITGVSDIVDESDRKQPVRIVVKLKKGEDPTVVLQPALRVLATPGYLQRDHAARWLTAGPGPLPLKEFLRLFVEHRINVIRRRTQYQLRQARQRPDIVEGLLIALHHIDEIIRVIRSSAKPRLRVRTRLMAMEVSAEILRRALNDPEAKASTSLTRMQADAILAMQLQRLTGLEADKLAQEYTGLKTDIAGYEAILAEEGLILDLIRADLRELKDKYANP